MFIPYLTLLLHLEYIILQCRHSNICRMKDFSYWHQHHLSVSLTQGFSSTTPPPFPYSSITTFYDSISSKVFGYVASSSFSDPPILPNPGLKWIGSHYLLLTLNPPTSIFPNSSHPGYPVTNHIYIYIYAFVARYIYIYRVTESFPWTRTCNSASPALLTSNSSSRS